MGASIGSVPHNEFLNIANVASLQNELQEVDRAGESYYAYATGIQSEEDEATFWSRVLADVHQHFIEAVELGRGDKLNKTPELYSGLIWNGNQAKDLGLIDGFGSVRSISRDKFDIEEFWDYTPGDRLSRLRDLLGQSVEQGLEHAVSSGRQGTRLSMQWGE